VVLHLAIHAQVQERQIAQGPDGCLACGDGLLPWIHVEADARGRTFSVHLGDNVFQCFDARCAAKGDVIDLWATVKGLSLRDAALDLVQTFALEPAPGTEKRNG
jgi:hypothetical protein